VEETYRQNVPKLVIFESNLPKEDKQARFTIYTNHIQLYFLFICNIGLHNYNFINKGGPCLTVYNLAIIWDVLAISHRKLPDVQKLLKTLYLNNFLLHIVLAYRSYSHQSPSSELL
jgi:hypothetical protein